MNMKRLFFSVITIVVIITFLWNQCILAIDFSSIGNKISNNALASQSQAFEISGDALLAMEGLNTVARLRRTGIQSMDDLAAKAGVRKGILSDGKGCLISDDINDHSKKAYYIFYTGKPFYHRIIVGTKDGIVNDKIQDLLYLLGLPIESNLMDTDVGEEKYYISEVAITPEEEGIIESFLGIIDPEKIDIASMPAAMAEQASVRKPADVHATKPYTEVIAGRLAKALGEIASFSISSGTVRNGGFVRFIAALEGTLAIFLLVVTQFLACSSSKGYVIPSGHTGMENTAQYSGEGQVGVQGNPNLWPDNWENEVLIFGYKYGYERSNVSELAAVINSGKSPYLLRIAAGQLLLNIRSNALLENRYREIWGDGYRNVLMAYVILGNHRWERVRWDEVDELGKDAVPALLSVLDTTSGDVKVVSRLLKYGNTRGLEYLIDELRSEEYNFNLAKENLEKLGYLLQDEPDGLENPRQVSVSEFKKGRGIYAPGYGFHINITEGGMEKSGEIQMWLGKPVSSDTGRQAEARGDKKVEGLIRQLREKVLYWRQDAQRDLRSLGYELQYEPEGLIDPIEVEVWGVRYPRNFWNLWGLLPDPSPGSSLAPGTPAPYPEFEEGLVRMYLGKPVYKGTERQSQYSRNVKEGEKEVQILALNINHNGRLGELTDIGDLSKLAEILSVEIEHAKDEVVGILQSELDKLKKEEGEGIFGAVKKIKLVDNLGGLESVVRNEKGAVAVLQDGTVLIDIDTFRNRQVLRDVVKHELWESILELVESNAGIREVTAIYQNLKDFTEIAKSEHASLIAFLNRSDNGISSQEYAQLLQYVVDNNVTGDALIAMAIGYVLKTQRYSHLRECLMGIVDRDIIQAVEKLDLAEGIYKELITATIGKPVVETVKNAELKTRAIKKAKMVISRLPVIETDFVGTLEWSNKFVRLDMDVLIQSENNHIMEWLEKLLRGRSQKSPFILFSSSGKATIDMLLKDYDGLNANQFLTDEDVESRGIQRENIGTLYDLGQPQPSAEERSKGLSVPFLYSVTGIYLAAQVAIAGGNINNIDDKLTRSTLETFYETFFGRELEQTEWVQLFNGELWPPAKQVTAVLNELRNAVIKLEIAA